MYESYQLLLPALNCRILGASAVAQVLNGPDAGRPANLMRYQPRQFFMGQTRRICKRLI